MILIEKNGNSGLVNFLKRFFLLDFSSCFIGRCIYAVRRRSGVDVMLNNCKAAYGMKFFFNINFSTAEVGSESLFTFNGLVLEAMVLWGSSEDRIDWQRLC